MDQTQRIQALEAEVAALRAENQTLRARWQRSLLERAIMDDEMSQNIVDQLPRFFPEPPTPWYVCILFFGGAPGDQEFPKDDPLQVVEGIYRGPLSAFGQPCFFDASGIVGCLLNLSQDCASRPETALYGPLEAALEQAHRASGGAPCITHIAVSQPDRVEQGPKPIYRGALSASEHRTSDSPLVCVELPAAAPDRRSHHQLLELERTFWRQIQLRSFYDAAVTLDQMILAGQQERGSLDKTLASVFSRMELVLNATLTDPDASGSAPDLESLLGSLSQVRSYQEMRDVSYDILATLEDQVYTPANVRNRKMPAIETYIREHYGDPNLGVNSIADAFKISASYLSRIFKSDMGLGLVEYIHRVRIQAAKALLTDPELTVDAVASQVGFSSRGVLNRVFKEQEGMTPGAYRAMIGHGA